MTTRYEARYEASKGNQTSNKRKIPAFSDKFHSYLRIS